MTKLLGYSVITLLGLAFVAVANQPNPTDQPSVAANADSDSTSETSVGEPETGDETVSPSEKDQPAAAVASSSNQDALELLHKALETLADAQRDPQVSAEGLRQARDELKKTLVALGQETPKKTCCEDCKARDCPPVKDCAELDAGIIVHLPPTEYRRTSYTAEGARSFWSIFSAAAARGVENATIRAMNATKVCPTCNSIEHKPDCPERQPD